MPVYVYVYSCDRRDKLQQEESLSKSWTGSRWSKKRVVRSCDAYIEERSEPWPAICCILQEAGPTFNIKCLHKHKLQVDSPHLDLSITAGMFKFL